MINRSKKILDGTVKEIKAQSKTHLFRVSIIPNDDRFVPPWGDVTVHEDHLSFEIPLNGQKPNDLLKEMMQYGEILGFHEIIPSIEEIFIQKINESHAE
jgi:ABC-2 type transport system ATP-binding protein